MATATVATLLVLCAAQPVWRSRGPDEKPNQGKGAMGSQGGDRKRVVHSLLAGVGLVLVLSAAVVTWWAVGDLSFQHGSHLGLFYDFRPLDIAPQTEHVLGVAASIAGSAALLVLGLATLRGTLDRRWWIVLALAALAAALAALIQRLETAGVVGANIGGGAALFFGVPVMLVLGLWAARTARSILRGERLQVPLLRARPGWYPQSGGATVRYWDGHEWTDATADRGNGPGAARL